MVQSDFASYFPVMGRQDIGVNVSIAIDTGDISHMDMW